MKIEKKCYQGKRKVLLCVPVFQIEIEREKQAGNKKKQIPQYFYGNGNYCSQQSTVKRPINLSSYF
jgi:hypothetical protein